MQDRLAPPPQQLPGKKKGPTYAKHGNIPPQRLSFPCQALFGEFPHNQDPIRSKAGLKSRTAANPD
jgi:hypothetical protein